MARTTWKQVERVAAALVGGKRHWANAGERVDVDSPHFAVQVKNPARMSLAELERLVDEMTVRGIDEGKVPLVVVKRSARCPTQVLVLMPADAFRILVGPYLGMLADPPQNSTPQRFRDGVRSQLRELPGMRKRVAEYVAKSKARARGTTDRTRRWRENGGAA